MKKPITLHAVLTIMACGIMTGCLYVNVPPPAVSQSDSPAPAPVAVQIAPIRVQPPVPGADVSVSVTNTPPDKSATAFRVHTIAVTATAGNQESGNLAEALRLKLREECAQNGFQVQNSGSSDVSLQFKVIRRTASSLGDFRVYEGTAQVSISASNGNVLAEKVFQTNCRKIEVDEFKAEEPVSEALSKQISEWLKTVLVNGETKEKSK